MRRGGSPRACGSAEGLSSCARALAPLVLLAAAAACRAQTGGPVNVLLIVLDTTRADAVGVYGGAPHLTPALDHLARDGVVFTNARSTSAWTVPAHGSLFTGSYPTRHGAHWESPGLSSSQITLAELLRPTHATAGFSENPHILRARGFAQGFDRFEETWRGPRPIEPPDTLDRLDAWFESRDRSRPFFVFVNLMAPHLPYAPPPPWRERSLPEDVSRAEAEALSRMGEGEARLFMSGKLAISRREFDVLRALYHAEVAFADEQTSRILAMVRRQGVLDRTLVIVVGDHGENIGDHGLMEHQLCLYETLLRVPLIMRLPGVLHGGERRGGPVQLVDVLPTVLDVLGFARQDWPGMDGRSLLGGDPPPSRPLIAELMRSDNQRILFARVNADFDFSRFDRRLHSIQIGDLKLIVSNHGEAELYRLSDDPDEARDIAPQRPAEVRRLASELVRWTRRPQTSPADGAEEFPELDEEALEALRSLGYAD